MTALAATATATPALRRMFRLQWEDAQQSWVLLYPEGLVTLNPSAAAILHRCDGSRTVAQIIDELQQAYAQASLAADVHAFVSHAAARGWLA